MTQIIVGDRVRFSHSDYADPRAGTVTQIYTCAAGRVAVIDYGARTEWHCRLDHLTPCTVTLRCAGPDCNETHRGLPRSRYCCPDHLDYLFGETWSSAAGAPASDIAGLFG